MWGPPSSTLFPYTTLFRSHEDGRADAARRGADRDGTHREDVRAPALRGRARRDEPREGDRGRAAAGRAPRSEEHTSELQSRFELVCRLLLEKEKRAGPVRT